MSRDVVFVKYNTSDAFRYKYISISVPYIYKCLEMLYFVKYNTSDELRYKYISISVPDIYKCQEMLFS